MAITIQQAANLAKSKTTDKRWNNAIDKAVALSGQWLITELVADTIITTESGSTYHVTESRCTCKAFELGQPCKHRAYIALQRVMADTMPAEAPARVPSRVVKSASWYGQRSGNAMWLHGWSI